MKFKEVYFDKRKQRLNIPIHFNLIREIKEDGTIVTGIPNHYFPDMVKHGALKIIEYGKEFYDVNEALDYREKMLLEGASSKSGRGHSQKVLTYKVVWLDSKGKKRPFEVVSANAKIGVDTIVLNMSTAIGCVSGIIGTCPFYDGECYSIASETQHDLKLAKDERQAEQWSCMTAEGLAEGLREIIKINKGIKFIRFNEAGDFRNKPTDPKLAKKVIDAYKDKKFFERGTDDIKKAKKLAKLLPDMKFYTYTRRSDLKFSGLPSNLIIQGSGYYIDNAFMPIPLEDYLDISDRIRNNEKINKLYGVTVKGPIVKCMGDCTYCKFCKEKKNNFIILPIHGSGSSVGIKLRNWRKELAKNPKFDHILASDKPLKEKIKELMLFFDVKEKQVFNDVTVMSINREEFFDELLTSEKNKVDFIDMMTLWSGKKLEMLADAPMTTHLRNQAIKKSIEALKGTYKHQVENAETTGAKDSVVKSWKNKLKNLEDAMEKSSKGIPLKKYGKGFSDDAVNKINTNVRKILKNQAQQSQLDNIKDNYDVQIEKWKKELKQKVNMKKSTKSEFGKNHVQTLIDNIEAEIKKLKIQRNHEKNIARINKR